MVEEFFQLFKTPWEMFREGQSYDVLLATQENVPENDAPLLVVFRAGRMSIDDRCGIRCKLAAPLKEPVSTPGGPLVIHGNTVLFETRLPTVLSAANGALAVRSSRAGQIVVRVGYDLFSEVRHLLTEGQSVAEAESPSLDLHIEMLRSWMIESGILFCEVPPVPAGFDFAVCLTHDIDFIGIRKHRFDHTLAGFLYRSLITSPAAFLRGKLTFKQLLKIWRAVASLPLVHLGLAKDFWLPFEWYLKVEKGLNPTYFLIPFRNRPGTKVPAKNPSRRASSYGIDDVQDWIKRLEAEECEVGVHGLDAWHDPILGKAEFEALKSVTSQKEIGLRIHWLLREEQSFRVMEDAGYAYDATVGYNETVGYKAGTTQAYKPLSATKLIEVPTHIQDGALFYGTRLGLSENEAWRRCERLIENAERLGGFINIIWHDRSHGPERFWGEFYVRLVTHLRTLRTWFASAGTIASWFRARREISFSSSEAGAIVLRAGLAQRIEPAVSVKIYNRLRFNSVETCKWDGAEPFILSPLADGGESDSRVRVAAAA